MSERATPGTAYLAASLDERMVLDRQARDDYHLSDQILSRMIRSALNGEMIADVERAKRRTDLPGVRLHLELDPAEEAALDEHFAVANQEKRGSWHIPENEKLSLGLIQMVSWLQRNPYATAYHAPTDGVNPAFAKAPHAVAIWVLEPLFEQLFLPIKMRTGRMLGTTPVQKQEKHWAIADPLYRALGIEASVLDPFRPGNGWWRLDRDQVREARENLINAWKAAPEDVGERYRAYRIGELVERYYSKAKNGQATRKKILTAAYGRTLTAYYGGNWLAFLSFLGEEPASDETVIQAVPKTTIVAGTSERTAEVAAAAGVSPEQVEEMLAAYWQQETTSSSPIEQRVHALKGYWERLDQLHAKQEMGMPSLVNLTEARGTYALTMIEGRDDETPAEELLSDQLVADIEHLWGTAVLARYPDRLVSQLDPIGQLVAALGPGLRFWAGAALTAWYMCVGPYSRTTLKQLSEYHSFDLEQLDDLGCPIPKETLRELAKAEDLLGPEEPANAEISEGEFFTITMSTGTRRENFEPVRDVITRLRREWVAENWDRYIRARWEADLRALGDRYHRETAKRGGKPPTFKGFAKQAATPANTWFAGRIPGVYAAIGASAPEEQTSDLLLPKDRKGFASQVFAALGGTPRNVSHDPVRSYEELTAQREKDRNWGNYVALANEALNFVQFWEALGEKPTLKSLGANARRFTSRSEVLSEDPEQAFAKFSDTIERVLAASK